MFIRYAASAVAGAAVSFAANHSAVPVLAPLAQTILQHREFASPQVGERLLAVPAVIALLLAASVATERRRNAFLDAIASRGRRLAGWLITGATTKVCFLCGALAGFGGKGWLAGLLTLVMYAGIFACVRALVVSAEMPARPRS
ncbi:hypothetical protein [Paraburkholderia sp. WC7.3g]|uniref:hypothetical protein n=1 Tax=Paraburkholderia sp. WC7.3g TaxID=2991070 RepID=UPI003D1A4D5A